MRGISPGPAAFARGRRRSGGFTLAELLVASAISAIVAMTAYAVLNAVVRGAGAVERAAHDRTVARSVIERLRREIAGAVSLRAPARPDAAEAPPRADGDTRPRASLSILTLDGEEGLPSEVAYTFEGETMVRWARACDDARPSEGVPVGGVEALGLRYGRNGEWADDWSDTRPPTAVAIRIWVERTEYVTVVPVGTGGD